MKNYIFIFTALLVSVVMLNAQTLPTNTDFYKKKELGINLEEFKGSQFLNESFVLSSIDDALANKSYEVVARYDILNDVFEIKPTLTSPATEVTFLKKAPATAIILNDQKFSYQSYQNDKTNQEIGYLQELGATSTVKVYVKHFAELRLPEKAKTTLEKDRKGKISTDSYFLLKGQDGIRYFDLNKKTVLSIFRDDQRASIKSFMKKTKNKAKDIKDIIALLDYAASLG